MFEGVSDHLHQFLTPRTTPSSSLPLPLPLNFALHAPPNYASFHHHHPFDLAAAAAHHQIPPPLHPHLHDSNGDDKDDHGSLQAAMDLEVARDGRSILMDHHHHHQQQQQQQHHPAATSHDHHWSNDELLALLRIRSNIDNSFPESTWEHVSRKLGEVGFRRTAEKCKEKFEEESRYFNHINYNKSCRFLTDLYQDQLLFHGGNEKPGGVPEAVKLNEALADEEEGGGEEEDDEEDSKTETTTVPKRRQNSEEGRSKSCRKKKRKLMRQKEFEMLKAYCEDIVMKMIVQQEEIHSKLLQDMLKREEEKVAKEETWKKQQMERLHKELEVMAHEQAIAGDRQATIIEILNQITNSTSFSSSEAKKELQNLLQCLNVTSPSSSSLIQTQTSSPTSDYDRNKQQALVSSLMALPHENSSSFTSQNIPKNPNPSSSTQVLAPQDPNSFIKHHSNPPSISIQKLTQNPKTREKELDDLGKRWPRDEVLALVNVRCSLYNNGGGDQEGNDQGSSKAPLWEKISQGMLQLGYKRSAKRCKEKWENINKYFRKTKDVNKKRSLDSRTCPYFHQLSTLYNQGGMNNAAAKRPENCLNSSENQSEQSENLPNGSQRSCGDTEN